MMSSAVTQVGKLPKKTVKLIQRYCSLRWGIAFTTVSMKALIRIPQIGNP
jgi:hypothetical protein